jgi:8-oxo-dGTP pyrophosphatase MutT (NUDIX family)
MDDFFRVDEMSVGTKGLVFIGDEVLVYRRDTNTTRHSLEIDLPGGGSEPGETPFTTFQRELKEEFGLGVTVEQIVYTRRFPSVFEPEHGLFGWFTVARLPASEKTHVIFGNEGVEYFIEPLAAYLGRTDAWAEYQQRAAAYATMLD